MTFENWLSRFYFSMLIVSQAQSASSLRLCTTSLQCTEARRRRKDIINDKRQHKQLHFTNPHRAQYLTFTPDRDLHNNISSFKSVIDISSVQLSRTSNGTSYLIFKYLSHNFIFFLMFWERKKNIPIHPPPFITSNYFTLLYFHVHWPTFQAHVPI